MEQLVWTRILMLAQLSKEHRVNVKDTRVQMENAGMFLPQLQQLLAN